MAGSEIHTRNFRMKNVKLFEDFQRDDSISLDDLFTIAYTALRVSIDGSQPKTYIVDNDDKDVTEWMMIMQNGEDWAVIVTKESDITLEGDDVITVQMYDVGTHDRSHIYDAELMFSFSAMNKFRDEEVDRMVRNSPAMKRYLTSVFVDMVSKNKLTDLDEAEEFFSSNLHWLPEESFPEGWRKTIRSRGAFGRF